MYTFKQKKEISHRIARVEDIEFYRRMLKPHRASAAGRVMTDRRALAESLVYNLLDFYTEEQLSSAHTIVATPQVGRTKQDPPAAAVKKKSRNSMNIRISAGKILTTLWSALQTAYSRTASTAGAVWLRLKERAKALLSWALKQFQR